MVEVRIYNDYEEAFFYEKINLINLVDFLEKKGKYLEKMEDLEQPIKDYPIKDIAFDKEIQIRDIKNELEKAIKVRYWLQLTTDFITDYEPIISRTLFDFQNSKEKPDPTFCEQDTNKDWWKSFCPEDKAVCISNSEN